jgi:outer membrane protein TolC
VIACGIALGGCASYHEQPLDPRAELASLSNRAPDVIAERVQTASIGHVAPGPFDLSDGLNEGEVVAVALTLNPGLQAKRLDAGVAGAGLIGAGLWPNPEVGVDWKAGVGDASGYSVDADALFELLRPGERSARKAAAGARVAEADAGILAEELQTVADARTRRLKVLAAEQAVALLDEEVALRERALELVERQLQLGDATRLEIAVAELEAAEVRRDRRKAQVELDGARQELVQLMGLPPGTEVRLEESGRPFVVTVFEDFSDEDLDRLILEGRSELRARQAAYEAAEQDLKLAVLGQYPRLGIGPSFERELEGDSALGLGLSLELPLLNQNQGEIAEKRAAREQARAEYVALLHRFRADAYAARAAVRNARAEVEAQESEVLPLIERNEKLFEGAFKVRELNVFDWIAAQQRAVRARREYLEALVRYREGVVKLEAATGAPLSPPATAPSTRPS